ncbi:hypothetical protein N7466_006210 [Penicillium verhagenii]|uniref:uncharacterized protein n=1 Tax=Penicillium verhagenii TaxID=1562060 RepID=UPI00254548BB|nr:uncharacterized protein N7466_006210 [Penicillium verhagenii]KAJ5930717.1 hypothetical protein N7466_006210 [Penicillium verhagenii]
MLSITRGHSVLRSSYRPQRHHALLLQSQKLLSTTSASLQSQPQPPTDPSTTVVAPEKHEINAPLSTLPAPLSLPDPLQPNAQIPAKLMRVVAIGRAYLTFYKTGLKNVFRNYRASLPLRKQLGLPAFLPTSPPRRVANPNPVASQPQSSKGAAAGPAPSQNTYDLRNLRLGRGQFQLVRRSARDVRRMIPFTMILVVCGEFTPLIVPLFGSAITPATCRVPGQIGKERGVAAERRNGALRAWVGARPENGLDAPRAGSEEAFGLLLELANPAWVVGGSSAGVLQACAVFGLVKKHDRAWGSVLVGLYRRRLSQYLEYLAIDDAMIRGAGGVEKMSYAEVQIALDERGAGDVGEAMRRDGEADVETFERDWLNKWLTSREL